MTEAQIPGPDDESQAAQDADRIRRLERRLDRERRARLEAEQIADAGLRSLYDANQELDRRILERTVELHHALAAAETANQAKSAFLGQMSHQINTPLNGLLGMLELLSSELRDEQTEQWHASAMRSARRLERLSTRLITYVELEAHEWQTSGERRQLRGVLSGVHDRWHGPCLRAGQLLSVEMEPSSDLLLPAPPELDLLFDELLSNVVEHAGPGAVHVTSSLNRKSDAVVVRVSDPGPGVDPSLFAHNHKLGASANQTKRGDHQIHLGLALVDRIVDGLGGSWESNRVPNSYLAISLPFDVD